MAEFNRRFTVPAAVRGTAFRPCTRKDLDCVFSIQTERVVDKDNTVAIRDRWWQIDKSRWRYSLAGRLLLCTSIWTARSQSASGRMSSAATMPPASLC
jgi:hypothetical protein